MLMTVLASVLSGCSGKEKDLAEVDWDRENEREYVATWSVEGTAVLEVTLAYHGKNPELPFAGPEPTYDWRSRDTDFYSCVLRNLTAHPVRLLDVQMELEKGSYRPEGPQGSSYIEKRWQSDVLPPGGSLTRRNTWVWGEDKQNTLYKTFRAEFVYEDDRDPVPFLFQVPIRYER